MSHTNNKEVAVAEIIAQLLLRTYDRCFVRGKVPPEVGSSIALYDMFLKEELNNLLHQELQKARERYENILTPLLKTMSNPRAGSAWNELAKEIESELGQPMKELCNDFHTHHAELDAAIGKLSAKDGHWKHDSDKPDWCNGYNQAKRDAQSLLRNT